MSCTYCWPSVSQEAHVCTPVCSLRRGPVSLQTLTDLAARKPHRTVAACPMTIKLFRRTIAPAPKRTNTHVNTHVNTVFPKFYCCRQIGHVLAVKTGLCSRLLAVGNQNGGGCVEGVGTGTCCEVMQSQHGPPGGFTSEHANRGKINN